MAKVSGTVSRYLEEAAGILRKAEEANSYGMHEERIDIARGFATLAAIDKGLLPIELLGNLINQALRKKD
ncbi:hypothetical protein ABT282_08545 [Streptomyces sp. NPDC000927]|uniref:hypothetical protein n=1 Tax=Streptomyces sp. NPDC000927 TaxID=3154371 RepID=UPI00331EC2F5